MSYSPPPNNPVPGRDPYASPASNVPPVYGAPGAGYGVPQGRPGTLTAIAVIGIVLGVLGIGSNLCGLGSSVFTQQINANAIGGNADPVQQNFQKRQLEIAQQYAIPAIGFGLVNLLLNGALLVGAILVLSLSPFGRTLLIYTSAIAIFATIAYAIFTLFLQMQMFSGMDALIDDAVQKAAAKGGGNQAAPPAETMKAVFQGIIAFAVCIGLFPAIVFIGYYAWTILYLNQPRTKSLFEGATPNN